MPIRPMPYTLECSKCRWCKTVAPASDALQPGSGTAAVHGVMAKYARKYSAARYNV